MWLGWCSAGWSGTLNITPPALIDLVPADIFISRTSTCRSPLVCVILIKGTLISQKLLIENYRLIQSNFMCPVFTSPNATVPKSRGDPVFIRSAISLVANLISASLYKAS
ncbi:hypothetical protein AOLI_G00068600 [Acnodon oligacanthus]